MPVVARGELGWVGGWVALGIVKEIAEANVVQHKNRTELNITSINNYSK